MFSSSACHKAGVLNFRIAVGLGLRKFCPGRARNACRVFLAQMCNVGGLIRQRRLLRERRVLRFSPSRTTDVARDEKPKEKPKVSSTVLIIQIISVVVLAVELSTQAPVV